MPPGKRRKVSQDENNAGDSAGSRVTPVVPEESVSLEDDTSLTEKATRSVDKGSPTDTVAEDGKSETSPSEKRPKNAGKSDGTDTSGDDGKLTTVKRSSGRVIKKTKRDISPPGSPVKKAPAVPKESTSSTSSSTKTGTPEAKTKRAWEQWQEKDIKTFFRALFEYGKDFDAIQNVLANRCRKRGEHPSLIKNKDQVRFFYYRTIHKINKFIETTNDVKKDTQELYALINYGILRDTIKGRLNAKTAQKLRELIHNGVTNVRVKGKNKKIRTPACGALKRLNNIEEHKDETPQPSVPDKIVVELSPKTNEAWSNVQCVAQNPRLRLRLPADRSLASVVMYLTKKWKEHRLKLRQGEGEESKTLTLYPNRDYKIAPVYFTKYKTQKVDVTFASYKENIMGSPTPSVNKSSKKSGSTELTAKSVSDNSSEPEACTTSPPKIFKPEAHLLESDDSAKAVCPSPEISLLMGDDNAMFPDRPLFCKDDTVNTAPTVINLSSTERDGPTEGTAKCDAEGGGESADSQDWEELLQQTTEKAKSGWTVDSGGTITLAQVYLMCGVDDGTLRLEYDWCSRQTLEAHLTCQLSNMLRRLAHLATIEFRDPTRVKQVADSSVPKCALCGAIARKSRAQSRGTQVKMDGEKALEAEAQLKSSRLAEERLSKSVPKSTASIQVTAPSPQIVLSNNSKHMITSASGDGVFRVPVGIPLVRYPQPGVSQVMQSLRQKSNFLIPKRRKMIRQKPMIVQRTLLPKAPTGQLTTILASNPPQLTANIIRPQLPDQSVQQLSPQTFSPASLNSPMADPNRQPGSQVIPSQTSVSVDDVANSPLLSSQPVDVPLTVNTDITSGTITLLESSVPVSSNSQASNLSISPPNLSSLLDMSLSCPPSGNVMADKLLDIALVNSNSGFSGLLDAPPSAKTESSDVPAFQSVDETSRLITPPHSPSHLGVIIDTHWPKEDSDMSLTSFLISTPSKKLESSQSVLATPSAFPSSIFSENSQESIVSKMDVDATLRVMMNENSMDYVSKFESLAAHIAGSAPARNKDTKP